MGNSESENTIFFFRCGRIKTSAREWFCVVSDLSEPGTLSNAEQSRGVFHARLLERFARGYLLVHVEWEWNRSFKRARNFQREKESPRRGLSSIEVQPGKVIRFTPRYALVSKCHSRQRLHELPAILDAPRAASNPAWRSVAKCIWKISMEESAIIAYHMTQLTNFDIVKNLNSL